MKCDEIKKWLPGYPDAGIPEEIASQIAGHLNTCADCRKEHDLLARSWGALDAWDDIEPDPAYVSRFWTRLAGQSPETPLERFAAGIQRYFGRKVLLPVYAIVAMMLIVGLVALRIPSPGSRAVTVPSEDLKLIESADFAENLDMLEDLDFLEYLDVIEHMDAV
ncbi:MAG: zf-HC2 domain-containing protein [Candidatus Omnitrophota bacterium]|jgi:hypothetical protein